MDYSEFQNDLNGHFNREYQCTQQKRPDIIQEPDSLSSKKSGMVCAGATSLPPPRIAASLSSAL